MRGWDLLVHQEHKPLENILQISIHHVDVLVNVLIDLVLREMPFEFQILVFRSFKVLSLILFAKLQEIDLTVVVWGIDHHFLQFWPRTLPS
jgi:hypothetical protein